MASLDRHRIGTFNAGGRFVTALDLNPGDSTYAPVADTFSVAPSAGETALKAKNSRRYGGAKRVGEIHDNGSLGLELYIQGSSADDSMTKFNALLAIAEDSRGAYFYEWRPSGTSYSIYYEVRGFSWEPIYRWIEFQGTKTLHARLSMEIAPLGLGDPLDISDDFTVDTLAAGDYTRDNGTAMTWISGAFSPGFVLQPGGTGTVTYRHTARGYTFRDAQATMKYTTGASGAGVVGVSVGNVDAANGLFAIVDGSANVRVYKQDTGSFVSLGSAAITALSANTTYWVRVRREGGLVTAEHWTTEPTPAGTPATSVSVVLAQTEAEKYVAGTAGFRIVSVPATDWRFDDFRVEPYTYRAVATPDAVTLTGIPGTAPAKVDALVGVNNPGAILPWALLGWARRPAPHNVVWNGDFEDSVLGLAGWYNADFTGSPTLTSGATLSRVTSGSKFGSASMQIVAGATANHGAQFRIYRKFRKGMTYAISFWAKLSSGDGSWSTRFANLDGSAFLGFDTPTITSNWQQFTGNVTATADGEGMVLTLRHPTASASTILVDGVQVYEGATDSLPVVLPALGRHTEGKGAYPPFGVLQGEAAATLSSWAVTSNANSVGGFDVRATSTAGSAEWFIDPSLLASDEFTDSITLEAYARLLLDPTLVSSAWTLSAVPESNTAARTYTEFGAAGRALTLPTAGAWRMHRLGQITLPVDTANSSRWRLRLSATHFASALHCLDYLVLVPARQRAAGATGKANDAGYPSFFHASAVEETKLVRSDLSALYRLPPGPLARDSGIGGQLLEVAPGDSQALLKLSSLVPDDPTSDATSESPHAVTATLHAAVQPRYILTRGS